MYKVFTSATLESQKQSPHAQAMEAFQSSQPFVSNNVLQTEALNFQSQCPAPKDSPMVILFTGDVKEECIPEFLEVMGGNCRGSRGEEGCIRFDLLRAGNKFMTYEVFESNEALEVHKDKAYTKAWGAFQYGDKKPLISKSVQKFKVVDLQETELLS
ncbi:unnamed protein product [Effrenium voratum]|nr:unnamed protein product [Effrenium voratum]